MHAATWSKLMIKKLAWFKSPTCSGLIKCRRCSPSVVLDLCAKRSLVMKNPAGKKRMRMSGKDLQKKKPKMSGKVTEPEEAEAEEAAEKGLEQSPGEVEAAEDPAHHRDLPMPLITMLPPMPDHQPATPPMPPPLPQPHHLPITPTFKSKDP